MIDICIMTSIFGEKRGGGRYTLPESIARCATAGFSVQDLSMCSMINPADALCADDWEARVEEILAAKEKHGVTFYQTHPPFRKGRIIVDDDAEREKHYWDMTFRSLDITKRIGAKWAVIHPANDPSNMDERKQLACNHFMFDKVVDYAAKLGIGIAFENMVENKDDTHPHRYFSLPEELVALCDDYHSDHVKACWDFGHGNTAVPEKHADALRMLGDRIVCLHVDDNLGKKDDHFIPFRGNIRWEELMPVLTEIGFKGVLDLELGFTRYMHDDLRDDAVRFLATVCRKGSGKNFGNGRFACSAGRYIAD